MQVSPFFPSFKLLRTGDFLLLLKTLTRICQSKLSQKLTGQKASMAPVSGELGAKLKRAKSQRMKEIEPHMQADEETSKASQILSRHLSPVAAKRQKTARKKSWHTGKLSTHTFKEED